MHKLYTNRRARERRGGGGRRRRRGLKGEDGGEGGRQVERAEWREANVAFNIGELHASAGRRWRRIRGGGKGVIAGQRGDGGGGTASRGGDGEIRYTFEIRGGRRGPGGGPVSCVCRIAADALTVPRACVTSPLSLARRDRTPLRSLPLPTLSLSLSLSFRPLIVGLSPRIDPPASTSAASHCPPPFSPSSSPSRRAPVTTPRGLVRHVEML